MTEMEETRTLAYFLVLLWLLVWAWTLCLLHRANQRMLRQLKVSLLMRQLRRESRHMPRNQKWNFGNRKKNP